MDEVSLDRVEDDRADHVADVGSVVDGRAAQVDPDLARVDRFKVSLERVSVL